MAKTTAKDTVLAMNINLNDILKALSNPIRLDIMHWLKNPRQHFPPQDIDPELVGISVSAIQAKAGLSQSTISSYLALLSRAQLVIAHRQSGWTYYRHNENTIQSVKEQLQFLI